MWLEALSIHLQDKPSVFAKMSGDPVGILKTALVSGPSEFLNRRKMCLLVAGPVPAFGFASRND